MTGKVLTILAMATGAWALAASGFLVPAVSSTPRSDRVLAFTRTTGYRHDSIQPAVAALQRAGAPVGISVESSEDVTRFTTEGLAPYGAVVLLSTTGEPLGPPGPGTDALVMYVRRGGGLVGIHAATDAYANADSYVRLLGGRFDGHPGDVRTASCRKEGRHPGVARLPVTFEVRDEFYLFRSFRPDNQVAVRCLAVDGRTMIPVAWHRDEGAGRVFYTTFGHTNEIWSERRLVEDHMIPALLWALGR
jgi:hypothetical protein